MTKQIPVASIRLNGGTQTRVTHDQNLIAEYAELYKAGVKMAPIECFYDGADYWLVDGFHRVWAADKIKQMAILADVKKGSLEEAIWTACSRNQGHGLRRSNADKKKTVEIALKAKPDMSSRAIADHCGVDHKTVEAMRPKSQVGKFPTSIPPIPECRNGSDGKTYPVPPRRIPVEAPVGTAKPPERPAKPSKPAEPIDDVGRVIPEPLRAIWARRGEFAGLLSALSEVKCVLQKAEKTKDPLFTDLSFQRTIIELDSVYHAVKFSIPYAVCGLCQGIGCRLCGHGLLNREQWNLNVPSETKAMIARQVVQGK